MTQADELPITTDAPNQWIVFGRFDARAVAATKDAATAAAIGLIEYSPGAGPYSVWEYVSAARLTAAQEQVERLREALRAAWIDPCESRSSAPGTPTTRT